MSEPEVTEKMVKEISQDPPSSEPSDQTVNETAPEPTEYWSNEHQCMLPINPVVEVPAPPANSHWDVTAQQWIPN